MIKRKTIGKIQVTLGIIVFLVSIVGIFIANNWYSNAEEQLDENAREAISDALNYNSDLDQGETEIDNETIAIIVQETFHHFENQRAQTNILKYTLWLFFSLLIILSIFYITQGLANLSESQ